MSPLELQQHLPRTTLAFRGYNVTNLGRSAELLAHPVYAAVVREALASASGVCAAMTRRPVDLAGRIERREETALESYGEAVALILAMQQAQLACLERFFGIQYRDARLSFGYSLGEIAAIAASGVVQWEDALSIPLALAEDCAALAHDVSLGVLFSRGRLIPLNVVKLLCLEINQEGRGVIGVSAKLSPNTLLLMGQRDTLERFQQRMPGVLADQVNLRRNNNVFPPLHTPIVWERSIPNRAGVFMHTLKGPVGVPNPPVFSLVTAGEGYNALSARDIMQRWTDHPQLLWDAVMETLTNGTELVLHIGPEPNLIPATYKRVSDNVEAATKGRFGLRAVQAVASQSWLSAILPERAALLRAPIVQHVILEDWLLEHSPA